MLRLLILIQALTFFPAGAIFIARGDLRLGLAQFCLAVVTALIYL